MKKIVVLLTVVLTIIKTMPIVKISNSAPQDVLETKEEEKVETKEEEKPVFEQTGNITNGGLVNEDSEYIYYATGESLYKFNKEDETNTMLVENSYPNSIQVLDDKIYYINDESYEIYKVNLDGTDNIKICDNKGYNLNICNDKLYFMDRYNKLHITSMSLNGQYKEVVFEKTVNNMMIYDNQIYYLTADGEFGQVDLDGKNDELIQSNIMKFDVTSTGIYYIFDPRKDNESKGLYKMDLDKKGIQKVMEETPYSFNVKENMIYYNHPVNFNLYSMDLEDFSVKQITGANTSDINIGEDCLLYKNLEDSKKLYKVHKDGTNRSSLEGETLVSNVIDLSSEISDLEGKDISPRLSRAYDYAKEVTDEIISEKMTEYERVKAVHDYVINNTTYDVKAADSFFTGEVADSSAFTAYGVLINNKGVCQGYAEATQILLTLAGIDSQLVVGEASNDQVEYVPHMWNLVVVDGERYMLDTTWDDPVGAEDIIIYDYFLIDCETLRETHRWAYDEYPSCNVKET